MMENKKLEECTMSDNETMKEEQLRELRKLLVKEDGDTVEIIENLTMKELLIKIDFIYYLPKHSSLMFKIIKPSTILSSTGISNNKVAFCLHDAINNPRMCMDMLRKGSTTDDISLFDVDPETFIEKIKNTRKEDENLSIVYVVFHVKRLRTTRLILYVFDTGFHCQSGNKGYNYISKKYGGNGKLDVKHSDIITYTQEGC